MKKILQISALALGIITSGISAQAQIAAGENYSNQTSVITHYKNPENVFTQGAVTGAVYETPYAPQEYSRQTNEVMSGRSNPAVALYPNPANTYTNIVLSEPSSSDVYIDIFDLNGNPQESFVFGAGGNEFSLDVSNLQRGLYSIQVQERGKSLQTIKLWKESN